ncbi:MAG: ZIP family metal transporter [Planctomycetota bacterium]|nr:ZIP family metal transporter [Planctomycetota bacterium]MDA1177914.1 ZIP family metal transporter [Planctomycetota bacterium]
MLLQLVPILAAYCLTIALASLAGGAFPLLSRLSHTGMQVAISFVGGVMLGVGMLHMLPHAATALGSPSAAASWMLVGFVVMFFLQRFSHFHHHEAGSESGIRSAQDSTLVPVHDASCQHGHSQDVTAGPGYGGPDRAASISWASFALGLGLHSLLDGIALAASVHADSSHRLAGLATFLAILLHKPFDSLTITLLMASRGASLEMRQWVNLLFALIVPLGVSLFFLSSSVGVSGHAFTGPVLAFAAGGFLCISASDLLPEVQFHSHDRLRLSVSLLAGVFLSWLIEMSHTKQWF